VAGGQDWGGVVKGGCCCEAVVSGAVWVVRIVLRLITYSYTRQTQSEPHIQKPKKSTKNAKRRAIQQDKALSH